MDMKILLIEDDPSIFNMIQERFAHWSLQVVGPKNFQKVMDNFIEEKPHLVLIDIQLPAYDGFHWCREIRHLSKVPILFLSSRDHPMDMVMAMQMGADDFIQKPFHMEVLLAKTQAILRRTYDYVEEKMDVTRFNNAVIDYTRSEIVFNGATASLTKNELFILRILVEQVNQIVSRDELMRKLWDDERFVNDNTLSVNVNRLRTKLEDIGLPEVILTKKDLDIWQSARGREKHAIIIYKRTLCMDWFFIFIFTLLNVLFSLDVGLNSISIWYVNISLLVSFTLFFVWRYVNEVGKLKDFLGNMDDYLDEAHKNRLVLTPFQEACFQKIESVFSEKNMELNQAKVQLQEYSDELLAWVHEVKAPLTTINLLLEHIEDVSLRRKLENEWLRLHLLVDQQLHQTRLASIEKDNYLNEVELKPIVYKEIRGMQAWCIEKGIGFEVAELTDTVLTDGKWLAFIVRQILSNAIKYSPVNSEVTIFTEHDPTGATLLHIKDVGIGIPLEDLPRIFQKSYTGTAGRESSQSTGMGLYLASNAARKMGIRIYVQSNVGDGSLFTLRFPLQNEYVKLTGR